MAGKDNGEFATLVKAVREALGMSRADFARMAGVSGATITKWEQGERGMHALNAGWLLSVASPELRVRIMRALGVENVVQFAEGLLKAARKLGM